MALALREVPELGVIWHGTDLFRNQAVHVGVATPLRGGGRPPRSLGTGNTEPGDAVKSSQERPRHARRKGDAMTDRELRAPVTRREMLGLLGGAAMTSAGPVGLAAAASAADQAALVADTTAFGLDLYAKLGAVPGNVFFSPYSISTALALAMAGARGATAEEMAGALRLRLPPASVHGAFARLTSDLRSADRPRRSELHTANAVWLRQHYSFGADFLQAARESYQAAAQAVDFQGAPDAARRTINAWVERETRHRIKDLLPERAVTVDTVLVLTNAVYFKGGWHHTFAKGRTTPGDFSLGDREGRRRQVPLMHQETQFRHLDGDDFQAIELPYDAGEMSMIVLLPRRVDGLADLERTITPARLAEWLAGMSPTRVALTLPRFKFTVGVDLKAPLMNLGMRLAFSVDDADFSGMVPRRRVWLSAAVHKADVDVTEAGTEAAAATGVAAEALSAKPRPAAVFRADHPFFFVIRDHRTAAWLFAGRLADPATG